PTPSSRTHMRMSGITGQSAEQEAGHRNLNQRLARLHLALVVPGESAIADQPGEASLHDPATRLHTESSPAWRSFYHLKLPAVALLPAPLGQLLATVGGICPDLLEPWHEDRQPSQELACHDHVVDIGRSNVAGDGQAQGVDQQMAFASLH